MRNFDIYFRETYSQASPLTLPINASWFIQTMTKLKSKEKIKDFPWAHLQVQSTLLPLQSRIPEKTWNKLIQREELNQWFKNSPCLNSILLNHATPEKGAVTNTRNLMNNICQSIVLKVISRAPSLKIPIFTVYRPKMTRKKVKTQS